MQGVRSELSKTDIRLLSSFVYRFAPEKSEKFGPALHGTNLTAVVSREEAPRAASRLSRVKAVAILSAE